MDFTETSEKVEKLNKLVFYNLRRSRYLYIYLLDIVTNGAI